LGFIGKDLIYGATLSSDQQLALYLTIAAVLTNVCLVAAGFMAGVKPFIGKLQPTFEKVHLPQASMWVHPLILAVLGLILGVFPGAFGDFIISPTISVLSSQTELAHLKIWHGFNTVLILSLATLGVGVLVYVFNKPRDSKLSFLGRFDAFAPQTVFTRV